MGVVRTLLWSSLDEAKRNPGITTLDTEHGFERSWIALRFIQAT